MTTINESIGIDTTIEVNENLCFNTALFEACKKGPHIDTILKGYGKAVSKHPVLIDIRQIHDLSSITDIHGNNYPRGFQTRAAEDLDRDTVDEIAKDMHDKNWDPLLMQGAVFRLPKEFEGMSCSSDGTERIYGIANLTHRYYAALASGQTHIIAWIIDIDLKKLRKWANAEANRKRYASNPRNDLIDITESILFDLSDKNSDISIAVENAPTPEKEEDAIRKEVESYNVHSKTRDAIIRRLAHKGGFTAERKKWDADFMREYVNTTFQDWVTSSSDIYDYLSYNDIPVILAQDEGRGAVEVATKWAQHVLDDNGPLKVLFSLKKSGKIDNMKADEVRRMFIHKVGDYMKMMGEAYQKIYVDGDGVLPRYEAFPEFAGETKVIKMY
jgi:hypothetical protein|tara:strand:- start:92 stop:1249 length:1158 start_codon:yes stop_codon:yes gene_type:complete